MFDTIGSLFKWFKEHFRDPIPGTPGTPRMQAGKMGYQPGATPSFNGMWKFLFF